MKTPNYSTHMFVDRFHYLTVVPYTYNETSRLVSTLEQWQKIIHSVNKNSDESCALNNYLYRSYSMTELALREISYWDQEDSINEIFFTEDKTQQIQSVVCFRKRDKQIIVEGLVSNPANVLCGIENSKSIKGAGSKLLYHTIKLAAQNQFSQILLISMQGTQDFYKKFGFIKNPDYRDSRNTDQMILTLDKVQDLYPEIICPTKTIKNSITRKSA